MPGKRRTAVEEERVLDLSPERALLAAMLRAAVADANSHARSSRFDCAQRDSATRWLLDRPQVQFWLDLLGLPDGTYHALLRAAQLTAHPEPFHAGERNAQREPYRPT